MRNFGTILLVENDTSARTHRLPRFNSLTNRASHSLAWITLALTLLIAPPGGFAQAPSSLEPNTLTLKKLSVDELMSVEVTSVSRRPERLFETASAIQVITQE